MSIQDKLKTLKKTMRESATGPLAIAENVVALVESWGTPDETGESPKQQLGMDANRAVKLYLGRRLDFFQNRAEAIALLGPDVKNWMEDKLAIYVANTIPIHLRQTAKETLLAEFQNERNRGLAITRERAQKTLDRVRGHVPRRSEPDLPTLRAENQRLTYENQQLRAENAMLRMSA